MTQGAFRKKPVVVQAFQMTQEHRENNFGWPMWLCSAWNKQHDQPGALWPIDFPDSDGKDALQITTLEGQLTVTPGDYIIQGVQGEIYPCKPDIFVETYDPA